MVAGRQHKPGHRHQARSGQAALTAGHTPDPTHRREQPAGPIPTRDSSERGRGGEGGESGAGVVG